MPPLKRVEPLAPSGIFTVTGALSTPTITWTPAPAIILGSAGSTVLNAAASAPGTFTYSATPTSGGNFARTAGFAVSLMATGTKTTGVVRCDLDAPDLMQLLGSMCMSATLTPDQSSRLLVMIEDGLRPPAEQPEGT